MEDMHSKGLDENYCSSCGKIIKKEAEICVYCGVRQRGSVNSYVNPNGKDWLTTLLLCFFLGFLGIHRFYTGHTLIGVVQLLTLGGCGIWQIIDFIIIIVGNFKDADGYHLTRNF